MGRRLKFFIIGDKEYGNWLDGDQTYDSNSADLIVFTGGEDVSPELYKAPRHPLTSCNPYRDRVEIDYFNDAIGNSSMLGICRGSQFLCVMSGGKLIQHQENPWYIHDIHTKDATYEITSTHHQAAYPYDIEHKILGWTYGVSSYHEDGNQEEMLGGKRECEIVYYPKTKCLGIQGHPEHPSCPEVTRDYLRELVNKFIKDKL